MRDNVPGEFSKSGIKHLEPSDDIKGCVVDIEMLTQSYLDGHPITGGSVDPAHFTKAVSDWHIDLPSRFNDFRTFKRQIEWLAGRVAFSALDEKYFGGGHQIAYIEGGAPCIESLPNPVSITHAGKYAAAAISLRNDIVVGIDIERIKEFPHKESFFRVAFPEEDQSYLSTLTNDEIMLLWTLKESFLKIVKKGFADRLKDVKIHTDHFIYKGKAIDDLKRNSYTFDNHILSFIYGNLSSLS
ncbi:MAG TPA: 4'-phosphopantetheinyl transferase superfamily protein [Spirochaetota bacterium]